MNTSADRKKIDSRLVLVGVFALFVAPVAIAMVWYWLAPSFAPPPSPNGELIDPPRPLEAFRVPLSNGDELTLSDLRGRWQLVQFVGGRCAPQCRERLYHTRQIRDALGEDRSRVERVVVAEQGGATPGLAEIRERHPRLRIVEGRGGDPFVSQFPRPYTSVTVFLLDPLGNLVMRFGAGVDPSAVLDDLEHLLKLSRIG